MLVRTLSLSNRSVPAAPEVTGPWLVVRLQVSYRRLKVADSLVRCATLIQAANPVGVVTSRHC